MTAALRMPFVRLASLFRITLVLIMVGLVPLSGVIAQNIQLTPAQRQMLDQLPPAQRRQALQLIEQQQTNGQDASTLNEELTALIEPEAQSAEGDDEVEEALRAAGGSPLVINLTQREELTSQEIASLDDDPALRALEGSGYFVLNEDGVLELPGLQTVPLRGLTEEQIEQRLGAVQALRIFDIEASILEVELSGPDSLEPFGYDVFEAEALGFEPVSSGPVPPEYVLGPGDSVRVQLFGNVNGIYEHEVSRDGVLNIQDIGPVTVAGLPFSEFRADINRRVQEMLIGTQVSVTMGNLRTARIFVLGDVKRPGSFVVSSLATISSALYYSGGISDVGTLRDVQLKRNGAIVSRLDLYDLLLNGDTSGDSRVQPGDVIFVPPIGPTVGVAGAVRRPAIYEIRDEDNLEQVIRLAGGLNPEAYPAGATLERVGADRRRTVLSVDAGTAAGATLGVSAGDRLIIPEVLEEFSDVVSVAGHAHRVGQYQWRTGMRLSDLIGSMRDLKFGADGDYLLIRREDPADRHVTVVSANLTAALANPGSAEDVRLQARDTVHVFDRSFGRVRVIEPILEELQLQARFGEPYREVSVSGQVQAPGTYPLESNMRISDLVRAGGNLTEEAYALKAELVRYQVVGGEYRRTEVVDIDLDAVLRGSSGADVTLTEHDNLRISSLPDWDSLWTITLEGEVKFPGDYRIRRGESLGDVLARAGGLTDNAFADGAIFLRESLRKKEEEQIEILARRLETDITSLSLQSSDTTGAEALATGRELLAQLRATDAVGRLVVDLGEIAAGAAIDSLAKDVELRDKDRLLVPKRAQEVTIIGETQQNTSHLYQPGLTRDDYIAMSGGLTRRADKKLIYVVRASGAVVTGGRSRWFGRRSSNQIRPGDTIVVPLDTDRIRPLTLWTNVTQILYQGALAIAAIDTFND